MCVCFTTDLVSTPRPLVVCMWVNQTRGKQMRDASNIAQAFKLRGDFGAAILIPCRITLVPTVGLRDDFKSVIKGINTLLCWNYRKLD